MLGYIVVDVLITNAMILVVTTVSSSLMHIFTCRHAQSGTELSACLLYRCTLASPPCCITQAKHRQQRHSVAAHSRHREVTFVPLFRHLGPARSLLGGGKSEQDSQWSSEPLPPHGAAPQSQHRISSCTSMRLRHQYMTLLSH